MRCPWLIAGELEALVLDLREVGDVSRIAIRMLDDLQCELAAAGCRVALVDQNATLGRVVSSRHCWNAWRAPPVRRPMPPCARPAHGGIRPASDRGSSDTPRPVARCRP
ncbi:hypothetical protein [Nocardia sp. NPDC004860]|uniref:hypothetical protein n=1 Tax=Nocardia sp. NPDC004860 TaxID=3154557 RepID=UPI00339EC5E5